MAGNQNESTSDPVVKAHMIRFLKDRPRVIDKGVRKDFLDQMQRVVEDNRKPENLASSAVNSVMSRTRHATENVAKDRVSNVFNRANEGIFNKL